MKNSIAAIILIAVGAFILASNLGVIDRINFGELVRTWWPLILIALGLSLLVKRGR